VRVSTDVQTVENQINELKEVAERRGWQVVEIYKDAGISDAKGGDQRPGLDAMIKDRNATRTDITGLSPQYCTKFARCSRIKWLCCCI
jgi:DNA invertase Pin-like site-specific DNA recombinase